MRSLIIELIYLNKTKFIWNPFRCQRPAAQPPHISRHSRCTQINKYFAQTVRKIEVDCINLIIFAAFFVYLTFVILKHYLPITCAPQSPREKKKRKKNEIVSPISFSLASECAANQPHIRGSLSIAAKPTFVVHIIFRYEIRRFFIASPFVRLCISLYHFVFLRSRLCIDIARPI